ncbi:hypothetical protein RJ640_020237 [Escallonia rubra]|uniref:DCL protein n=1 Tax=Escallonia rubra TaxID=112253 RepID=A0AA88S3Y6_9ASTE|nr:hypothetical protein RJ640_020237 [Escallonia rubra]
MAAISSQSPCINHLHRNPISLYLSSSSSPAILSFPYHHRRFCALKSRPDARNASSNQDGLGSDMLRKPVVSPALDAGNYSGKESDDEVEDGRQREEEGWVDWEDQILEDTVPLVGFINISKLLELKGSYDLGLSGCYMRAMATSSTLLTSVNLVLGIYESGDRLSPEHERTILERLLPYHPECDKKIGSGVDYITVGYHPDFESSRCLFIVRKDGELVDFSYWKCLKGLIRKNYPLYADSFILRHFRRRRRSD